MAYTSAHPSRILNGTSTNIPYAQRHQQPTLIPQSVAEMSDSDAASPSEDSLRGRCLCGREVNAGEGGIYCSVACARSDAFSSLCYKPVATSSTFSFPMRETPSVASSASLSRNPSSASNASTSTSISNVSATSEDWNASHYRRLARADMRREERREERKKRRAESISDPRSTIMSTSSSLSRVPDLVGGHSRNVSVASSCSSAYTVGSLSRNPSSASTASSRRYNGVNVEAAIMEDEDEEEMLAGSTPDSHRKRPIQQKRHQRRRGSNAGLSSGKMKELEAFGMGKDMRDVLEDIIQMEKVFVLSDSEDVPEAPRPGLFTAQFNRPPRTPSPVAVDRRRSSIPAAPAAPPRGHRQSLSHSHVRDAPQHPPAKRIQRPPSLMGLHQSSLSESHTALYLATASPSASTGRRSASPKLAARQSLTFTPDSAGPSIGMLRNRFESPAAGITPSKRRPGISPSAVHPTMDHWRFPTSGSTAATPTRPPPINTANLPGSFATPTGKEERHQAEAVEPQLLWPPSALPPPPLAPALFPCSPAAGTPDFMGNNGLSPDSSRPPHSGLRLGVLLGSGEMDVDMDESDEESTAHGHGMVNGTGYLPVFLEAEGFRTGIRWQ